MSVGSGGPSPDGLVAIGGVFTAAIDAYKDSERRRVDEVASLRQELAASREREAQLRSEMNELKETFKAEIAKIRSLPALNFDFLDVAGVWFCKTQQKRVTVSEGGQASYDDGTVKKIKKGEDGVLQLADSHTLAVSESSSKRLVWTGQQQLVWVKEMPGGSRQVELLLDVAKVIQGHSVEQRIDGRLKTIAQRIFDYKFSLIGCTLVLTLCRNKKGQDGKMIEGEEFLGVHCGLAKDEPERGAPASPNSIDAIRCSFRVEIAPASGQAWQQVYKGEPTRYEAGGTRVGSAEALAFARFRQIATLSQPTSTSGYHTRREPVYQCQFRVIVTDIGLLELSRKTDTPMQPKLEQRQY